MLVVVATVWIIEGKSAQRECFQGLFASVISGGIFAARVESSKAALDWSMLALSLFSNPGKRRGTRHFDEELQRQQ